MARPNRWRLFARSLVILVGTTALAVSLSRVFAAQSPKLPAEPAAVPKPPLVAPGTFIDNIYPSTRDPNSPYPMPPELEGVDLNQQSDADVAAKSTGCMQCHQGTCDPHEKKSVHLGCTDCHGGNPKACAPAEVEAMTKPRTPGSRRLCPAGPRPQRPEVFLNSANPLRSYTALNHETPEFVRFVNPGDLRINHISCGTINCHARIVMESRKSMMTHGCMLWGAALYNNGSIPNKIPRFGEFYGMRGAPLRAQTVPPPTDFEVQRGVIPFLDPLIRFEVSQPGNILRIFERGGKARPDVGLPNIFEDPGRPIDARLSDRGLGTQNRTDPVFIGLTKTRLFNPTLNFIGTNDSPGDFRQSGCTACHVIYANDRSPVNASSRYAKYGNRGMTAPDNPDPTIPKDEPGHPIAHRFASGNSIPASQCMTCHVHPGTTVMNSYLGYMWWDEETDADLIYPEREKHLTAEEYVRAQMTNPNESSARSNLSNPEFLANLTDLNAKTKHTQFADFHSHGWAFRAVFRHDRKGNYLDYNGDKLELTPENRQRGVDLPVELAQRYKEGAGTEKIETKEAYDKFLAEEAKMRAGAPMHLMDVHLEKGMHCVDCHFVQDEHGNNRLQMEVRAAVEILCIDCHGTTTETARLRTSGPAAYTSNPDAVDPQGTFKGRPANEKFGRDLAALRTPSGKPRFERRGDRVFQRSMVEPDLMWEVVQTKNTIDPKHMHYNAKSAIAKTVRVENDKMVWGEVPANDKHDDSGCAHSNKNMTCISCHSSWNPSCYGCHLPQRANFKMPALTGEGDVSRNYTSYNFQTLRDEVFMLAKDGNATGNRINPSRSSCAIHVGSYNQNRESIYVQQQTHSGEGFSGIAFSTNVPHTFSAQGTTKQCTDCHLSYKDDNNALIAQLLMQGTNYLNFVGRYCWVAAKDHGLFAVVSTERDEPQTVFGSTMHKAAFPERFEEFVDKHHRMLEHAHEHPGKDIIDNVLHPFRKTEVLACQNRGEYCYAACGEGGVRVFDIAFIDDKGFSERISTAPVSPIGQRFYVPTCYATSLAAPATTAPDPTRTHYIENAEGRIHALYGGLYVTDKYEGLIIIGAGTLLDGNPMNNFLKRDLTFNPDGILAGAKAITIVGTYAYICADAGLVVVALDDPKKPEVKCVLGKEVLHNPKVVACQFRYAYVGDDEGIKVLDITDLAKPKPVSKLEVPDVHSIYVARTYAYVAAGKHGLVILDVENAAYPKIDQVYNAGGCINDLHDVKLGITYTSEFAYLADGKNGMRIVQLTSPDTPGNMGFSPRPTPELIATYKIPQCGHAIYIAKGLDRDRAVDESGNQLSVFGRLGARPFNLKEQQKMYLRNGKVWKVSDDPKWEGYTEKHGK
jgi:hypothetical protein